MRFIYENAWFGDSPISGPTTHPHGLINVFLCIQTNCNIWDEWILLLCERARRMHAKISWCWELIMFFIYQMGEHQPVIIKPNNHNGCDSLLSGTNFIGWLCTPSSFLICRRSQCCVPRLLSLLLYIDTASTDFPFVAIPISLGNPHICSVAERTPNRLQAKHRTCRGPSCCY